MKLNSHCLQVNSCERGTKEASWLSTWDLAQALGTAAQWQLGIQDSLDYSPRKETNNVYVTD